MSRGKLDLVREPTSKPVKGNISGSRPPGHRDYAGVKISPGKGERCFATEAEARAAGWTKAP